MQGAGPCGGYGFLLPESCEAPGAPAGAVPLRPRIPSSLLPGGAAGAGVGSLPPGPGWQRDTELIPAPFEHPSDLGVTSCHPLGLRPQERAERGEICTGHNFSSRPDTLTHTHRAPTHTTECNRTQCKTSFTHTQPVCARLTRYSTAGTGQPWLGYCTGVNVNNKASSERLRQRPKNSCFVQKCP